MSAEFKLRNAIDKIERIDFLITAAGELLASDLANSLPLRRQMAAAFSMLEDEIVNLRHFFYGETLSPTDQQPTE